jgi:hypothetical protein
MSTQRRPPKRFAPLDPTIPNETNAPPLKGIVFDVDGTLWYVWFLYFCVFVFFVFWILDLEVVCCFMFS